jgi:hypothetical protein
MSWDLAAVPGPGRRAGTWSMNRDLAEVLGPGRGTGTWPTYWDLAEVLGPGRGPGTGPMSAGQCQAPRTSAEGATLDACCDPGGCALALAVGSPHRGPPERCWNSIYRADWVRIDSEDGPQHFVARPGEALIHQKQAHAVDGGVLTPVSIRAPHGTVVLGAQRNKDWTKWHFGAWTKDLVC